MKCVEISASACISDWWGIEGIILTQWRDSVKDINQISVTFYCLCPIFFSTTSAVTLVRPYDASFKTFFQRLLYFKLYFLYFEQCTINTYLGQYLSTHTQYTKFPLALNCFLIVMPSSSVSLSSGERMNQPSWLPVKDFSRHLRIVFNYSVSHDLHFRRRFTQQWTNCTLRTWEHAHNTVSLTASTCFSKVWVI